MLEPNYPKWRPPMNAGTRIIENGDLPVGWLDKLVQTGLAGGGGGGWCDAGHVVSWEGE